MANNCTRRGKGYGLSTLGLKRVIIIFFFPNNISFQGGFLQAGRLFPRSSQTNTPFKKLETAYDNLRNKIIETKLYFKNINNVQNK